jgi:hypothetical protein
MGIILIIIMTYLVFLWDFKLKFTNDNWIHEVVYTGLLWVILDHYSIIKYRSSDKPKKWVEFISNRRVL